MISNDNFTDKNKIIAEINSLYAKYDDLYSGVEAVNAERKMSKRGQSIIMDITFYLQHPKYYLQFETASLQLLKDFSRAVL